MDEVDNKKKLKEIFLDKIRELEKKEEKEDETYVIFWSKNKFNNSDKAIFISKVIKNPPYSDEFIVTISEDGDGEVNTEMKITIMRQYLYDDVDIIVNMLSCIIKIM